MRRHPHESLYPVTPVLRYNVVRVLLDRPVKPGDDNEGLEAAMAYDENNVFAKVLRGEIPCHKIYEDADTLAFLDIMPRAQGHALVVTKEKARDFFDISPGGLAKLMTVVQKLAPKIQEAMGAQGVLIQQFNGAAAGQTVFHLHVHIIPRKEGEALKPHAGKMEDQAVLAATAEKIRKKLQG